MIRNGKDLAFITIGNIGNAALAACEQLSAQGIDAALYDIRFLKHIDEELLEKALKNFSKIITIEDGTIMGGLGSAVTEFANDKNYKNVFIQRLGIPDRFIEQGTLEELHHECGIDVEGITGAAKKILQK